MNRLELAAVVLAAGAAGAVAGPSLSAGAGSSSSTSAATIGARVQRLEQSVSTLRTRVQSLNGDLNALRTQQGQDADTIGQLKGFVDKLIAIHNCGATTIRIAPSATGPLVVVGAGGYLLQPYKDTPDCAAILAG